MRQPAAEEMSKEVLKAFFSVIYDVALSEIFSSICLVGWTPRDRSLSWGKAGRRSGSWGQEWK